MPTHSIRSRNVSWFLVIGKSPLTCQIWELRKHFHLRQWCIGYIARLKCISRDENQHHNDKTRGRGLKASQYTKKGHEPKPE